jgi:putative YhbY family RNA-binding protein
MKQLTHAERSALRARAHALNPIVMIGSAGLTPAVLKEIDLALKSHELIKIRMLGDDREAREQALERICSELDASPVQLIGKMLVAYRPEPEPEKKAPPARRGKQAQGTKRRDPRPGREQKRGRGPGGGRETASRYTSRRVSRTRARRPAP